MEHMKMLLSLMVLLVTGVAFGADSVTTNPPPSTITGVALSKDARQLVVKYDREGKSYELKIAFTNAITDFRYSRWMGDQGIAVVGATANGEFHWRVSSLYGTSTTVPAGKIPAPEGKYHLVGIANTGGDSVVITAINHKRLSPDQKHYGPDGFTGWMFIDNCPIEGRPDIGIGKVVTFEIPAEPAKTK